MNEREHRSESISGKELRFSGVAPGWYRYRKGGRWREDIIDVWGIIADSDPLTQRNTNERPQENSSNEGLTQKINPKTILRKFLRRI